MVDDLPQPQPIEILSKAASIENIVTWLIASRICKDPRAFGWFMQFAADRVPVEEKIRLLGKMVEVLPDPSVVYIGFLDDLRVINRARIRVAHSIYVPFATDNYPPGHVMFKKGLPDSLTDEELHTQVGDALERVPRLTLAFDAIGQATGLSSSRKRGPEGFRFPQRYTRRTRWQATVLDDDVAE